MIEEGISCVRPNPLLLKEQQYATLRKVLNMAYEQATEGKGKERHEELGVPFEHQIACRNARIFGIGAPLSQVTKKAEETPRLSSIDAQIREVLGIGVYMAAAVIKLLEDKHEGV